MGAGGQAGSAALSFTSPSRLLPEAALPISMFLLAVLDVIELDLAFVLAQWIGFGILAIYSYVAARASGGTRLQAVVGAVALTAIGGALIAFNALTK